MPLHYHDFITPKSSGNAAIGKAVALGFLFLLVALGDDFFAQANTVGLEVEERAFRYGENLHRTHVTFRQGIPCFPGVYLKSRKFRATPHNSRLAA